MNRRKLAAIATVVAVVLTVGLALLPPSARFVNSLFASEKPSAVAGEPVPRIVRAPAVRVAVAGDPGTGDAEQQATARQMARQGRGDPYDALLLLGDLVYEDGDAELTDERVTEPFSPLTDAGAELMPALGNHDYESGEQDDIMAELGRPQPWYVDRVGTVRVVVLDSNQVENVEQDRWLRETLAARQPPRVWTVVAMHHPPYSAGYHGSDLAVRRAWSPVFAEYDVPLVLAGHEHDYQRTHPLDGVTYVVSGAAAKLRKSGSDDFTAVSATKRHFLDLLFYGDRIVGRAIDQSGRLVDSFTIER